MRSRFGLSFAALAITASTACALCGVCPTEVFAARPEDAPLASRNQVADALRLLAPVFAKKTRHADAGADGTIEQAIQRYVPGAFHSVSEGTLPAPSNGAHCPLDMGLVASRFCVDRYEGSLVVRAADGTLAEHSPYVVPDADQRYVARSVAGVVPQAYISAAVAARACEAAGKRLCQPVEWRAACGGSEGYAYPYGPTRAANVCHDTGVAPMLVFHADALKRPGWGVLEMNEPRLNQLEGTVARTGAFPGCVNDYGLYDMVGNLHEWTADPHGTFQGGYWLDTSLHGDGCAYRTIAHPFDYHDYSTGFRCCADALTAQGASL